MSDATEVAVEQVEDNAPVVEQEAVQGEPDTADEALGDAGKRALDAERTARKEAEKRLNEALARVEQFEDAQRSDAEKVQHELETLRAQVEEANKERAAAERANLVQSVASEYSLPAELAARLTGEDRDELVEDAKVLQKLIAPSGPRKPAPVPEVDGGRTVKRSNADVFADLLGDALTK